MMMQSQSKLQCGLLRTNRCPGAFRSAFFHKKRRENKKPQNLFGQM